MKLTTMKIPVTVEVNGNTKTLILHEDKKEMVSNEDIGVLSSGEILKKSISISQANEDEKTITLATMDSKDESFVLLKYITDEDV